MTELEEWQNKVSGVACPMCSSEDRPDQLMALPSGRLLMLNDGDFKGYCIIEFKKHSTELFDLSYEDRLQLFEDVSRVARELNAMLEPGKINYVILGNEIPHLHVHIIPRFQNDGWWGRPTWLRPADEKSRLSECEYFQLREILLKRLNSIYEEGDAK